MNYFSDPKTALILNTAKFYTLAQSFVWTIFSITFIILRYNTDEEVDETSTVARLLWNSYLYYFIDEHDEEEITAFKTYSGVNITSKEVIVILFLHLFVNLAWFISGWYLKSNSANLNTAIKRWSGVTILVILLDVASFLMFFIDYLGLITKMFLESPFAPDLSFFYCTAMTISLRGYVLWFINVNLVTIVIKTVRNMDRNPHPYGAQQINQGLPQSQLYPVQPFSSVIPENNMASHQQSAFPSQSYVNQGFNSQQYDSSRRPIQEFNIPKIQTRTHY